MQLRSCRHAMSVPGPVRHRPMSVAAPIHALDSWNGRAGPSLVPARRRRSDGHEVAELHMVSQPGVSRPLAVTRARGRDRRSCTGADGFSGPLMRAWCSSRTWTPRCTPSTTGWRPSSQLHRPGDRVGLGRLPAVPGAWPAPDLCRHLPPRPSPRALPARHSSDDARGSMVLADRHRDLELTARRPTRGGRELGAPGSPSRSCWPCRSTSPRRPHRGPRSRRSPTRTS